MHLRNAMVFGALVLACKPVTQKGPPASNHPVASFDANAATNGVLEPSEIAAPRDGWWEATTPCPAETSLVVFEGGADISDVPRIDCRRQDGTKHGPATSFDRQGERLMAGHYRDGRRHGEWLEFAGASTPDEIDVTFYDEGVGIGTWRRVSSDTMTTLEHRTATEVYRTERRGDRVVEAGLLVDGVRQGAWIVEVDGEPRDVEFVDGRRGGIESLSGVPECDAFAERWRRCIAAAQGAERYELASTLTLLVDVWGDRLTVGGEPLCAAHMRTHEETLRSREC